jgi:hypothetical protein
VRWIVSIVTVLCLLAAANERPNPRLSGGSDASQLTLASPGGAAHITARRTSQGHHARLDAFAISVVSARTTAPRRPVVVAATRALSSVPDAQVRSVSIRGPPLG